MGFQTYQGIVEPYGSTWFDGRDVTVFPSGKVVSNDTGDIVRKPRIIQESSPSGFVPSTMGTANTQIIMLAIVAIVAIVALKK